jgi:hypothetical protein
MWLSLNGPPVVGSWHTSDFGAIKKVTGLYLWNYNEGVSSRGMKAYTVSVSNDNTNFTVISTTPTNDFRQSNGGAEPGELRAFEGAVACQYVRVTCVTNYGDGSHVGISEIRFLKY